jgi:hypothetical protein
MQIVRILEGESEGVDFGWVQPRECLGEKFALGQRRKKLRDWTRTFLTAQA